jgi:hypothetical protein
MYMSLVRRRTQNTVERLRKCVKLRRMYRSLYRRQTQNTMERLRRCVKLIETGELECAWLDRGKPGHATFRQLTFRQLQELFAAGHLKGNDLVWLKGTMGWRRVDESPLVGKELFRDDIRNFRRTYCESSDSWHDFGLIDGWATCHFRTKVPRLRDLHKVIEAFLRTSDWGNWIVDDTQSGDEISQFYRRGPFRRVWFTATLMPKTVMTWRDFTWLGCGDSTIYQCDYHAKRLPARLRIQLRPTTEAIELCADYAAFYRWRVYHWSRDPGDYLSLAVLTKQHLFPAGWISLESAAIERGLFEIEDLCSYLAELAEGQNKMSSPQSPSPL